MILVDDPLDGPDILDPENPQVKDALAALASHFQSRTKRPPVLPEPDPALLGDRTVVHALADLFHGKCSYCETPIPSITPANVDHFRPTSDAVGADGQPDHAAYWWLSYAWSNLMLSCLDCVRNKGKRFPVDGPRTVPGGDVVAEQPLLLNPRSAEDNPERWLLFYADGTVASENDRGRATIEIFGLGRTLLVQARKAAAAEVTAQFRAAGRSKGAAAEPDLSPSAPFLALRRQIWAGLTMDASLTPAETAPEARANTKSYYDSRAQMRQSNSLSDDLSTVDSGALADYFSGTRWIERIEVRNVRPIKGVDLELNRSTAATAPWMVVLGDNGSGKSSMLQAVALTLVGADYRRRIGVTPDKLLRRGARRGWVKIWLSNLPDPIVMEFAKGAADFTGSSAPQVLVLGYGATRLRGSTDARAVTSDVSHVDNLFDARHELTDPNTWLLSLDEATFAAVVQSLHGLLALEPGNGIGRDFKNQSVYISYGRHRDPFRDLSDGYQSMLVLACDVMRTVMSVWSSPALAEGIVIIDEIGTHLHPRWRMRIVSALRAVLPRIQFLVSTHDPLCLRGLEDGEITVVNRNNAGDVVTITDLPSVKGLRVDQLLTSEHFGLGSAMDPDVDRLYEEYYALRGEKEPTAEQRARLAFLEAELERLRQLGVTQRERLMLETADQLIADRRQRGDAKVAASMSDQLAAIWTKA